MVLTSKGLAPDVLIPSIKALGHKYASVAVGVFH